MADWLRSVGVGKGDRVAAYVSQVPEAVVALLAIASIGAIWVGVGAELAPKAAIDRFNLLQPKALIAVDGYPYRGKVFDKYGDIKQIVDSVPSIERVVVIPNMRDSVELSLASPCMTGGRSLAGGVLGFHTSLWNSTNRSGYYSRPGLRVYPSPWFTATVAYYSRLTRLVSTWIINRAINSPGTQRRHG